MKKLYCTVALFGVALAFAWPVSAQQIGVVCPASENVSTVKSLIPTEGIIQCIPDELGRYYWQPMGAGIARYDTTGLCTTEGSVRWNGSAIQFCDGTSWQSLGGGTTLVVGGCQTSFSDCPAGYRITSYFSPGTYNCCDRCGNPSWKYTVCSL
ncbi:MAG: hypothetical protein WAO98_06665 [Alphaproteobacteria bacterium]